MAEEQHAYLQFLRLICRCGGTIAAADRLQRSLVDVVLWETKHEPIPVPVRASIERALGAEPAPAGV